MVFHKTWARGLGLVIVLAGCGTSTGVSLVTDGDLEFNRLSDEFDDASTIVFDYNKFGLIETITDSRGLTQYTYDDASRIETVDNPDSPSIAYTYNDLGLIDTLTSPAGTTAYSYNSFGMIQTVTDPVGRCRSRYRVIRGGSWYYGPDSARCGLRYTHRSQDLGPSLGFRLVREIVEP